MHEKLIKKIADFEQQPTGPILIVKGVTQQHSSSDPRHGQTAGRRVLVFGGTFDPPHLAHTRLAELAAQQLECDEILFIPAAINPLKSERPSANQEHRIAMLLLAIADVPNARISTIELERAGKSYTIDTLRELQAIEVKSSGTQIAANGGAEPRFFLLIGADQALEFHRWKDWQQILQLARPAVMVRPPLDEESFAAKVREVYSPQEAEQWLQWTLRLPQMDVSATEIRRRLTTGECTDGLLHPAVAEYIRVNQLYQSAGSI